MFELDENEPAFQPEFERLNYGSRCFLLNSDFLIEPIILVGSIVVLLLLATIISLSYMAFQKYKTKLKNAVFWNL